MPNGLANGEKSGGAGKGNGNGPNAGNGNGNGAGLGTDAPFGAELGIYERLTLRIKRLLRALGLVGGGTNVRDTLEELIEEGSANEVEIDDHERGLLRNVLGLRDIVAQDVMVPRADISAVEASLSIPDLVAHMIASTYSRLPVYRETLDDVIGVVHIKDVLAQVNAAKSASVETLVHEVLFVAPTIRAFDLLQEMRLTHLHLALVVDEFGGIDGLITIEDLVEEIVGEISDEHDVEETPKIKMLPDGSALADGRARIEELEKAFGPLPRDGGDEGETVAGLIFGVTGRIARRGEIVRHDSGLEFEIVEAEPRRLKSVRVRRGADLPADQPDHGDA